MKNKLQKWCEVVDAAIVIVKWERSSIIEKESLVFSIAVATSVELLLTVISMTQGTFLCYWRRSFRKRDNLKHFAIQTFMGFRSNSKL